MVGKKKYDFKIDGVNIYTLLAQREFELTQNERLNLVDELLYDDGGNLIPYLEQFFDNTQNNGVSIFCPSSIQTLSGDINVCKGLETLANYLLYSPDGERLTQKVEYNFYKDKDQFKRRQKECSFNFDDDVDHDEALDFLIDSNHNYLLETNQKVYAKDLKRFPALKEYQDIIDLLVEKIKNMKIDTGNKKRYKVGSYIADLRKEQAELKSMLAGTIIFKHVSSIGEKLKDHDVDGFDFEAVKDMFLNSNPKQLTPFGELIDVLQDILAKIEVNEAEKGIILLLLSENKANYAEIARKMDVSANFIHQTVGKLRNKIIKEYMRMYEDWFYIGEDYGWYKTCSVCGEVKLLSGNYFRKDSNSSDGFRSICKKCT